MKIINGIRDEKFTGGYANGIGCLAAQYVAKHKDAIGGLYITKPEHTESYNYEVRIVENAIQITFDKFKVTPDELLAYQEPEDE